MIHRGKHPSGNEDRTRRTSIGTNRIIENMQARRSWTDATIQLVNLRAFTAARRKLRRFNRFSTRFAHGWLPTRDKLHTYGQVSSNTCILYNRIETQNHVVQCPQRAERREGFIERHSTNLSDKYTDPHTQNQFQTTMESWLLDEASPCNCEQRKIGGHLRIR
jgi:hypothetical protein